ncbi:MAG: UpxY family transcription antiterminator [Planctomycetota bacterium]
MLTRRYAEYFEKGVMPLSWTKSRPMILDNNVNSNENEAVCVSQYRSKDISFERQNDRNLNAQFWYALHTRRHHENTVVEILRAREIETYLPVLEERRRWTYRTKVLKVPLFPNYVFARFDQDNKLDVVSAKGVVQIVGTTNGPSPIPDAQIEAVQIMVESQLKKDPYPYLVKGLPVRVKRGPLKGREGVLLHKGNVHRFVVCLPILGQSISVEINPSALKAI